MPAYSKVILSRIASTFATFFFLFGACACTGAAGSGAAVSATINVVAAENFYGDIAQQLGGPNVKVTSIISDPNTDPHEYESSTQDAKAIASANLVIVNGAGYDSFMDKLLAASPNDKRRVITVADVLGKKKGDNPHFWYDVTGMQQLADQMTRSMQGLDASDSSALATRSQRFTSSLQPLIDQIDAFKAKYAGTHVTQTEPVFGYMGEALGLMLDDGDFQHAVEEGTDPSPQAVAQIEQELTSHTAKALLYNSQTTSSVTTGVQNVARQAGVPVVGVSETEPANQTYQNWMLSQLSALRGALGG